jgi:hypothetical protein
VKQPPEVLGPVFPAPAPFLGVLRSALGITADLLANPDVLNQFKAIFGASIPKREKIRRPCSGICLPM